MKIFLPNSAHLQNLEGFIRKYDPRNDGILEVSMHDRYVHMHPAAITMAASAAALVKHNNGKLLGKASNVRSLPYLVRIGLVNELDLETDREIQEHEEAGRFIPITRIESSKELSDVLVNLVPLLHTEKAVADPIKYVFSETVRNVLEHAQSPVGAYVCAQYYRNKNRLSIGVADAGIGIWGSMRRNHRVSSHQKAICLALKPGISGTTSRIGGDESNAGAGLFFTKSIAAITKNFFVMYSGDCLYKLLRGSAESIPQLNANPEDDNHHITENLPFWQGTVIGIDFNVDPGQDFASLMSTIRQAYKVDVKAAKKDYFRRIRFT